MLEASLQARVATCSSTMQHVHRAFHPLQGSGALLLVFGVAHSSANWLFDTTAATTAENVNVHTTARLCLLSQIG